MHKHSEKITLPFSKKQLFDLVMDIEKYPEFLPWCCAAKILYKTDDDLLYADLEIGYKGVNYKYTSEVRNSFSEGVIDVNKIRGPFRHLKNVWKFTEMEGETEIDFTIELELKSQILDHALKLVFKSAYHQILSCFITRAEYIYGTNNHT